MSDTKSEVANLLAELKAKAEKVWADLEHRLKTLIDPSSHEQVTAQLVASKASLDTHLSDVGEALNNVASAGSVAGDTVAVSDTAVGAIGTGDTGAATGSDTPAAGSDASGAASDTASGTTGDAAANGDGAGE